MGQLVMPTGTGSSTVTVLSTVREGKSWGLFEKKRGGGNSLQRALLELTAVFLSHPFFSLLGGRRREG
jgi:hypothetical protein